MNLQYKLEFPNHNNEDKSKEEELKEIKNSKDKSNEEENNLGFSKDELDKLYDNYDGETHYSQY